MISKDTIPLGYVELSNGAKAIFPMNDIFLNYAFQDPAHWEVLRMTVNILITAYKRLNPETKLKPITGKIEVRTQFKHLLGTDGKSTRDQDIKLTEDNSLATYLEFQNRARANVPLEVRSVEYFGLGIGNSKGRLANQMWLLAEDVESVLRGNMFTRYILKDEITGKPHPTPSGIKYVSLTKLSKEQGPAGELALFLLGKAVAPKDEDGKTIKEAFDTSFSMFKTDKEVAKMLTLRERGWNEGLVDGMAIGEAKGVTIGAEKMFELIQSGLSPAEAMRRVKEEESDLTEVVNAD